MFDELSDNIQLVSDASTKNDKKRATEYNLFFIFKPCIRNILSIDIKTKKATFKDGLYD
jgi:hypothetical protein